MHVFLHSSVFLSNSFGFVCIHYRHLKQLGLLSGNSAVWWKAGLGIVAATAVGLLVAKALNSDK
jgi:hypothetical protein